MGTIPAESILSRVDTTLFDETRARWTQGELLQYLSDGQRMTVQLRPESNPKNRVMPFIAGTRQTLPDGTTSGIGADMDPLLAGFQLLDIVCNMGANGQTPGGAIRMVGRSVLDRIDPNWHMTRPATPTPVRNFTYDTKDRYHFYIYPLQNMGGPERSAEIIYSAVPAEISDVATPIEIDDIYEPNLYHFVMYRALIKDAPGEDSNPTLAQEHYRLFATPLLGKGQVDALLFPLQQMEREGR